MRKTTMTEIKDQIISRWSRDFFEELTDRVVTDHGNYKPFRLQEDGNSKLVGDILTFGLPAVKTCLNCSDCKDTCYARRAERYDSVVNYRDVNYQLAKEEPEVFKLLLDAQIDEYKDKVHNHRNNDQVYLRIHTSGDFFSQDYLEIWKDLAEKHDDVKFWTYTKVSHLLDFSDLPENLNVIDSLPEGKLNYGSPEYVHDLADELDSECTICPAVGSDEVKCVKDCTACVDQEQVLFYQH